MFVTMLHRGINALLIVALTAITPQLAAQAPPQSTPPRFELEIRNDNDMYLFILQDQYYTNGVFLNLRKRPTESRLGARELNRIQEWRIGHLMYNAYTAQIDDFETMDRPFTAFLFGGFGQSHFYSKEQRLSYGADLGVIGRWALGEPLQRGMHYLLNMYHTKGWEYQLKPAVGLDIQLDYSALLWRPASWLDASFQTRLSLGSNHSFAQASPILRIGKLNPVYSSVLFDARLQARERFGAHRGSVADSPGQEFFLYVKPQARRVAYNATLQGGMYLDYKGPLTVEPEDWLLSSQVGFMYANESLSLHAFYLIQNKESSRALFRHQYGSLSLALRF